MSGSKFDRFKRTFGKLVSSNDTNFQVRSGKVDLALRSMEKAVEILEDINPDAGANAREELKKMRGELTALGRLASQGSAQAKQAFEQADALKDRARDAEAKVRFGSKQKPYDVATEDGSNVKLFHTDIPGFADMSPQDRKKMLKLTAEKVKSGQDLLKKLQVGLDDVPPDPKDVVNIMWAVKSKAQEKMSSGFQKGAITVPDEGNALRNYLDKCQEVYGRDSSHFKEQQGGTGQQPRGMDFYEGTEDGMPGDTDRMLPSGMRAVLYQTLKTPKGDTRLYLKMETESARVNPLFKKRDETPEARPKRDGDNMKAVKHFGNLVHSEKGDDDLQSFREHTEKDVNKAVKKMLSKIKSKVAKKMLEKAYDKGLPFLRKQTVRVNIFADALDQIVAAGIALDGASMKLVADAWELISKTYNASGDIDLRGGGEIVLSTAEMLGDSPPPNPALLQRGRRLSQSFDGTYMDLSSDLGLLESKRGGARRTLQESTDEAYMILNQLDEFIEEAGDDSSIGQSGVFERRQKAMELTDAFDRLTEEDTDTRDKDLVMEFFRRDSEWSDLSWDQVKRALKKGKKGINRPIPLGDVADAFERLS